SFTKLMSDILGGASLWATFVTVVVIAPLTEEFFFRGLVLRGFLDNYGVGKAIFVSALLFGLLHLNPWQFAGAIILGLVFGWWYVRTASLWPCLIGHAVNNAIPVILIGLLKWSVPGYTESSSTVVRLHPLWLDAVGLAVVALGTWTLWRLFDEYYGRKAEAG
ncbi:MAG: CPBP family intramembrane metalloprotease, partial [bacterium]|nr:CPBP family intramembrane metalloprotease [bacterium]